MHTSLLDKWNRLGMASSLINWCASYLRGHTPLVLLNSVMSDLMDVIMGVPQGSILGPLLFMIFINELTRQCSDCGVHLYADDTILGGSVQSLSELWSSPVQGFLRWKLNCFQQGEETFRHFVRKFSTTVHTKIKMKCSSISVFRMILEKVLLLAIIDKCIYI